MDHEAKLKFVLAMTKHALEHVKMPEQHFDQGGNVLSNFQNEDTAGKVRSLEGGDVNFGDQGLAGGIASFLGTKDNFQAGSAPIVAGTNQDQLNTAYNQAQTGLNNQNQVTNTLLPQTQQAVAAQTGLSGQLQQRAAGQGPNPALDQLNQATAANTANQAALMASQRGASSNPGLIARQAAMQGAQNQQTAAGQAATLQAQQQIAAQQELAGLSGNQINQAGQAVTNQNSTAQGEQGVLQNANTSTNNANVGMQSNINNTNAETAIANQKNNAGIIGQLFSGGSSALGGLFGAEGGEVDEGGFKAPSTEASDGPKIEATPTPPADSASSSGSGSSLAALAPLIMAAANGGQVQSNFIGRWLSDPSPMKAKGGMIQAVVSPGERYLPPKEVKQVAEGKKAPLKAGEKIPGKPKFPGNDYRNDTVPKKLKEGGIVIPNKVLQSKNPGHEAKKFVQATLAKKGLRKGLR